MGQEKVFGLGLKELQGVTLGTLADMTPCLELA
jgi:hypothetical protein